MKNIFLLWLFWACLILGFQWFADARMQPQRPDYALEWTPSETGRTSQRNNVYLSEPFMNRHTSMDSEYYLSIAVAGYDDPIGRTVADRAGTEHTLNYAFFPLYPMLMRALSVPLSVLGLNAIATATLAGVVISLLGTLAAVCALYDLTRDELEQQGAFRAAFYLLIFPSGFFLAQVFTEGLFVGLAFGCLALIRRKQLFLAGVCALFATWTRALGVVLVLPLALAWYETVDFSVWRAALKDRRMLLNLVGVLLPLAAYVIWELANGATFRIVEERHFGRGLLAMGHVWWGWSVAFEMIFGGGHIQSQVYYLLELGAVSLAVVACLFTLRQYPGVAIFGLVGLGIALTSGAPQSLIRYVLCIPAIFIFLGHLGRSVIFDRVWTVASVLLLALQTALFTYDMWVA